MSTKKTTEPDNQFSIDALPPEVQQALRQLDEYARKPRQIRSAEDLAELEDNVNALTEQLVRTALAHAFENNQSLSPELKLAAEEMVRNFSMRTRDGRGYSSK